jgi:hypothetical protein
MMNSENTKVMRVYADTSIIGGCCDDEFYETSRAFIELVKKGSITMVVSTLLLDEIMDAPEDVRNIFDSLPAMNLERVDITQEALTLRDKYIEAGILGRASADDALHVAIATMTKVDLIISWNFRHIVHYDKIRKFNAINMLNGYSIIDIRSPLEVV